MSYATPYLPLVPKDREHYLTTLYRLVQDGPVGVKPGAELMRTLRKELTTSVESDDCEDYTYTVEQFYKVVTDSLVAAVHRSGPHELINRTTCDFHVVTDEEEYQFHPDEGVFEDDDAENESERSTGNDYSDQKNRKREELRRKRREHEELLKERKVMGENASKLQTIGPFPAPRLTVRADKNVFYSRMRLMNRAIPANLSPSASEDDEEQASLKSAGSSSLGDPVAHLTEFLTPLSIDSLKKIGESAKAKLKPSLPHDEFVSQIVKTAVRCGSETACLLLDKQKVTEDLKSHFHAGALPTGPTIEFLNSLPDSVKQTLSSVLGLPSDEPPVLDMWEKMLAIGFNSVLTNLRLKPLKKIFSELSVPLPDINSTEECCKALVYAAFPREEIRAKVSRQKSKKVMFVVPPEKMYTKGDMGFITFEIHNISEVFAKKSERYYSPEFTYADLKWSVLCMIYEQSNLALYLCQTGSVHCKFIITLLNHLNVDDSILNEGTQSFLAISQENDWGFNNVIKFVDLLNPEQGFLNTARDSITIEVGIVLVESIKAAPKEKPAPIKEKKNSSKETQAALQRLLEDEQAEANRKKVKQEINKTIKDEEKTRKDIVQKGQKAFQELLERQRQDAKKLQKDMIDREKKEEQERQKEQEALKQARQTKEDFQRQVERLKEEDMELQQHHKTLTQGSKNVKRSAEKLNLDLKAVQDKLSALQATAKQQEKKVEAARKKLQAAQADMPKTPSASSADEEEVEEEETAPEDDAEFFDEDMNRLIGEMTAGY